MLILVRHGRTVANASGLLLGRLDPELDEVGEVQARAVAAQLAAADRRVSRVVSSPLARTRATAAVVSEACEAPMSIDERWIELDYGEFDGVPMGEVPPETWASWRRDNEFSPPGGESLATLGSRVRGALVDLVEEARDHDVIVVSHVSPIKAAVAWALGVGDEVTWRMYLSPASITTVAVTAGGPSLHAFNVVAHL